MTLTGWGAAPMAASRPVWLPAGETERQMTPDRGKTSHSDHRSSEVEMDRSERSDMDTLYDDKELNDMNEVSEQDGAPLALAAAGDGAGQGLRRVLSLIHILSRFAGRYIWIVAIIYSLVQGVVTGMVAHVFEAQFPGIVIQAALITLSLYVTAWALYTFGVIKVTKGYRTMVMIGTLSLIHI